RCHSGARHMGAARADRAVAAEPAGGRVAAWVRRPAAFAPIPGLCLHRNGRACRVPHLCRRRPGRSDQRLWRIVGNLWLLPASGLTSFLQLAGAAGATAILSSMASTPLSLALVIAGTGAVGIIGFACAQFRFGAAAPKAAAPSPA